MRFPVPCRSLAGWVALCAVLYPAPGAAQEGSGAGLPGGGPAFVRTGISGIRVDSFRNISGDPADDWIGEGIAATLDADLASRTVQSPGSWLVRGGYQRLGDRIRLTAELLDARTRRVELVTTVDGATSELFALQDALSARLARALAPTLPVPAASPVGRPMAPASAGRPLVR